MFHVYKLTAPSGRAYVGYTGQAVAERWRQHVMRALRGAHHPLCAAIRKYGAANFKVETLAAFADSQAALSAEVEYIAALVDGYNISPGGEGHFAASQARMVELRKDPAWDATYRASISAGCKASPYHTGRIPELAAASSKWREENPRAAWAALHRATRVARKVNAGRPGFSDPPTAARRAQTGAAIRAYWAGAPASVRMRRAISARDAALHAWAQRTPAERAAIFSKISATTLQNYAARSAAEVDAHSAQLQQARKSIDRAVQGPAASAGLKRYWAELKADPQAYAAHMATRSASLRKTLESKKARA